MSFGLGNLGVNGVPAIAVRAESGPPPEQFTFDTTLGRMDDTTHTMDEN